MPAGRFTGRKHPVTAAETPPRDAGAQRRCPRGGSHEAHHRRDQALQAGRGEVRAAGVRRPWHNRQRSERLRPAARPHRGARAHRRARPGSPVTGPGSRPAPAARRLTSFAGDRERRTAATDRWLASLLGSEPGVALVAVGGYGRRELLPGSDLDVLLLHSARQGIAALADRIWYPIWDSGTRLDHAVRRPADARKVARRDVRVALGLLHARHVAGTRNSPT